MHLSDFLDNPVWLAGIAATVVFSLFILFLMGFGNVLHAILYG